MFLHRRLAAVIALTVVCSVWARPAAAELEDQLSAYTGVNAEGYMAPLIDAFGADMNAGFFHSAYVPKSGFWANIELRFMTVRFSDSSRDFRATTEGDFTPQQTAKAPTVVGSRESVKVPGDNGTNYFFPGGFDIGWWSFAVPQLRVGSLLGTEAIFRYLFFETGNEELGDVNLYGFGIRHSVSQYADSSLPVDLALNVAWQNFSMGTNSQGGDLVAAEAFSIGVHASKSYGNVEPYAGFSVDWFGMDLSYVSESDPTDTLELSFGPDADPHVTFGVTYKYAFVSTYGEYNFSGQNALSVGLAFHSGSSN